MNPFPRPPLNDCDAPVTPRRKRDNRQSTSSASPPNRRTRNEGRASWSVVLKPGNLLLGPGGRVSRTTPRKLREVCFNSLGFESRPERGLLNQRPPQSNDWLSLANPPTDATSTGLLSELPQAIGLVRVPKTIGLTQAITCLTRNNTEGQYPCNTQALLETQDRRNYRTLQR